MKTDSGGNKFYKISRDERNAVDEDGDEIAGKNHIINLFLYIGLEYLAIGLILYYSKA